MKILYLVPQPKRADRIGAYSFIDEEIEALARAGIEAFVLSVAASADRSVGLVQQRAAGVRTAAASRAGFGAFVWGQRRNFPRANLKQPLRCYRTARLEYAAARIVREERIDLVHSHFAWPQGFGGLLSSAATGRPLVATLRGTDILVDREIEYGRRIDPCFDRAVRRLLRVADRTMYFSNYMRDRALALGASAESARMIRKGVDLSRFGVSADRRALRQQLGLGSAPMILTVAGLIRRKGVDHLLRAVGQVDRSRDFTFVICGDGPERGALEDLARGLGISDRTRFVGRVDRKTIPAYFAACDVFVLASIVEAAGNVLFEAMAAGRPVVCTDSGGPPEYVRHGETGFVVPVADPSAMSARIRQFLDDPELGDRLGLEGRRSTVGEFDYKRMVQDIIKVYDEVLVTRCVASRTQPNRPLVAPDASDARAMTGTGRNAATAFAEISQRDLR
jgi:glycosyltransferase involved in cell wall biosynthesis